MVPAIGVIWLEATKKRMDDWNGNLMGRLWMGNSNKAHGGAEKDVVTVLLKSTVAPMVI